METICHIITKLELGGAQEVALYAVSAFGSREVSFRPGGRSWWNADRRGSPAPGRPDLHRSLSRPAHPRHQRPAGLVQLVALLRHRETGDRAYPQFERRESWDAGRPGWHGVPSSSHTVHGFGITPTQPVGSGASFIMVERITGWITTHWMTVAQIDAPTGRQWRIVHDSNVSVIRPGIDPRARSEQPLAPSVRSRLRGGIRCRLR